MELKYYLRELTDSQRMQLHGIDNNLRYAIGEFKRMLNILDYGGSDLKGSVERCHQIYTTVMKTIGDDFDKALKSVK